MLRAGKDHVEKSYSLTDRDLLVQLANEAAGEAVLREWAELLVEFARVEGVESRCGGLLTALVQCVPQTGLGQRWLSISVMSVTRRRDAGRGTRVTGRHRRRSLLRSGGSVCGHARERVLSSR